MNAHTPIPSAQDASNIKGHTLVGYLHTMLLTHYDKGRGTWVLPMSQQELNNLQDKASEAIDHLEDGLHLIGSLLYIASINEGDDIPRETLIKTGWLLQEAGTALTALRNLEDTLKSSVAAEPTA